jgi:hypothetical protein
MCILYVLILLIFSLLLQNHAWILFNSWNCVKLHDFFSLQELLSHKVSSKFIWTMNYLESDRALEWQICQQRAHSKSKFHIGQTFNVKFAFIHTQSNSLLHALICMTEIVINSWNAGDFSMTKGSRVSCATFSL